MKTLLCAFLIVLVGEAFGQVQVRTNKGWKKLGSATFVTGSPDSVIVPATVDSSVFVTKTNLDSVKQNRSLVGRTHAGGSSITTLKKTANQTINSGAGVFTDVTGLTFPVVSGTDYAFRFYVVFQSAATATGWKASVNCPAGTLDFFATGQTIANAAAGAATWLDRHNVTRDDMTLLTATVTQNVDLVFIIEGRYMCTANGTFAVRFANELASNTQIVVQKGSWGFYF